MNWETITPIIIAVVGPFLAYLGAVHKGKTELKALETRNKHELEKLNAEVESQAKLYEQNKQTDVTATMLQELMRDPKMRSIILGMVTQEFTGKK